MKQAATVQRAKGPLVWLDMDQKALDDAYDQMVYAPNRDQVHKRNMFNSRPRARAARRAASGCLRPDRDRGARPVPDREAERADQRLHPRRRLAAALGQGLRVPGRDVRACRRALRRARLRRRGGRPSGDLLPMADQVRRGGRLGLQERQELRRRPEPALCVGHSSGAHLAGNVVTTDWKQTTACRTTSSRARCCAPACTT